jgi:hypothetical protein
MSLPASARLLIAALHQSGAAGAHLTAAWPLRPVRSGSTGTNCAALAMHRRIRRNRIDRGHGGRLLRLAFLQSKKDNQQ